MNAASRMKNFYIPLGGALVLAGVAFTLFYKYIKNNDEEEEEEVDKLICTADITIPSDTVGLVIGRKGTNIKLIQLRTATKINFSDLEVEGNRCCTITGLEKNVILAKQLISRVVSEKPQVLTTEFSVPVYAVGRIIGRNGDSIKGISRRTGAKVTLERKEDSEQEESRRVVLKGTQEEVDAAIEAIVTKVKEEDEMRQQIEASAANMSQRSRKSHEGLLNCGIDPPMSLHQESLVPTSSDQFIEVYVSAAESATHFWVQVVGRRSVQLDHLITNMTEYYSLEDNKEFNQLDKMEVGDVVAAKFPHDDSCYRARVCEIINDLEDHSKKNQIIVYYLDFGDTETINVTDAFELRTDFLQLNYQAIECLLSDVDPESCVGSEAAEVFRELSHTAKWKIIMAQVVGYSTLGDDTLPSVLLVDNNGPLDVNVAKQLVERNLAKWSESKCSSLQLSDSSDILQSL